MKANLTKFVAALVFLAASSIAWAQCPTSPNYPTDFSANQTCLTLNGNAGFTTTGVPVLRLTTTNSSSQSGSAWFTTQQQVASAFSTTFKFQLGGNEGTPGDGFAFVIQAAGSNALGPIGCGIGFGASSSGCTPPAPPGGIPTSLAVEFNTYLNGPGMGVDDTANSVTIQNCSGSLPNSVDRSCTVRLGEGYAVNNLSSPILADGSVHTVTISYSGPSTKLLDVILDNVDLFPGGVVFDMTTIGLNSGTAYVGFTAATGAAVDNHDILSWTFTPQAQTAVVSQDTPAILPFSNAAGANVYDFSAQLTAPYSTPVVQIKPILMSQAACDAIVQKNFWPARCFVYHDAENSGMNSAVMFEVTCPNSPGGTCGSNTDKSFFAQLGTDFEFVQSENPFFTYPGIFGFLNPFPGFLKGDGPNPLAPCTPPATGPLFKSNQVDNFFIDNGHTTGGSGGGASCWVATYDTPGEIWPGIKITSPAFTTYTLGQTVTASYKCSDPFTSKPTTSPTGPYLTVATCTQSELPAAPSNTNSCTHTGGQFVCTGPVDTSTLGLHTFFVAAVDSGTNRNVGAVTYRVVKKRGGRE